MRNFSIILAVFTAVACSGPVGRFGPSGPFRLVEFNECDWSEPCSFSHDGQGHTYNKFYGYKLTILRLESGNGEVSHVVLRSKQKQFGAN